MSIYTKKIKHFFRSDPFITVALFLIALLGSIFSPRILTSTFITPFQSTTYSIDWFVLIYWCFVIYFVCGAYKRQKVKEEIYDARLSSLSTLPPQDTITLISDSCFSAAKEVDTALKLFESKEKQEEVIDAAEKVVRTLLDSIINIAQLWDDPLKLQRTVYRANVMLIININDVEANKYFEIAKEFCVVKTFEGAKKDLTGFVVLPDNKLTTTTESNAPLPDSSINSIAFPFTDPLDESSLNLRNQNILGAPIATVTNKPCFVTNIKEIIEAVEHENGFDDVTKCFIREYYTKHNKAKSMCSIPLMDVNREANIGVVNIYSEEHGMLQDGNRMRDYSHLITPFLIELSRVLPKLFQAKESLCAEK